MAFQLNHQSIMNLSSNKPISTEKGNLNRCKSLPRLCYWEQDHISNTIQTSSFTYRDTEDSLSDSSIEIQVINDSSDDEWIPKVDSGICDDRSSSHDVLAALEDKIEKLSELCLEQRRVVADIQDALRSRRASPRLQGAVCHPSERVKDMAPDGDSEPPSFSSQAKSLLDAIETSHTFSFEREVKDALVNFLNSDELRQQTAAAAARGAAGAVRGALAASLAEAYVPALRRAQRAMLARVSRVLDQNFFDLEEATKPLSRAGCARAQELRRALQRHRALVDDAARAARGLRRGLARSLENELRHWSAEVLRLVSPAEGPAGGPGERAGGPVEKVVETSSPEFSACAPQPPNADTSVMDQLLEAAEINKLLSEGRVAAAFSRALNAQDLALLMAACRGVAPARVFAPCALPPAALLALLQQLATDMVYETHLKCRYLEDALLNLNTQSPVIRKHLAVVMSDVHANLTKFLASYPDHQASKRISLIILVVSNMMK